MKELRLQGVSTIEDANAMLSAFLDDYNRRFGKEPLNPKNLHRLIAPDEDLREAFVWREERTVSASLTLQYDKVVFVLEPSDYAKGLVRKRVTVKDYPDGRLLISHEGRPLPFMKFDKVRMVPQGAITDNKRLGSVLHAIKASQQQNGAYRSQHAPRRLDQSNTMFNPSSGPIAELKKRRRLSRVARAAKPSPKIRRISTPSPSVSSAPTVEPTPQIEPMKRLPLAFSLDNPLGDVDHDTQIMLEQMAIRNGRADEERRILNRRRYWSRRRHLTLLAEDANQQDAA